MLIRDAILVAGNTMLWIGELFNLKWKDILQIKQLFDEDEKRISLVTINVRSEIFKTRQQRSVPVRDGEYLERIRARAVYTDPEYYLFCAVGKQVVMDIAKEKGVYNGRKLLSINPILSNSTKWV